MLSHSGACVGVCVCAPALERSCVCEDKLYSRVLETSVCDIVYIMFSWSNKHVDTKKTQTFICFSQSGSNFRSVENECSCCIQM